MASRFVLPFADVGSGIKPSSGAQLFFFETGTSTPKDTFTDQAATTPNTNPVIADSNGLFSDIFCEGIYKVVLKDKDLVQIWEADPAGPSIIDHGDTIKRNQPESHIASAIKLSDELTLADVSFVTPVVDTTGVVDESAKILAILNDGFSIKLPAGIVRFNIKPPNGAVIVGMGAPRFDDTKPSDWDNFGTLVNGGFDVGDTLSCVIGNLSIDNFNAGGNCIEGIGAGTGYLYVKNVNTRANNHGHLYETATLNSAAGLDPTSDVIGNIVVEDCEHWDGPNGFVTKHHRVSFIRCKTWQVTVQGFVALSDNINAATTYNRATDSEFIDCFSEGEGLATGGAEGIRVSTQDRFSVDPANDVNTNGVLPCDNVKIVNYRYSILAGYPVRIGDNANPSVASLNSQNIFIDGLKFDITAFGQILFQHSAASIVSRCRFGAGVNVDVTDKASTVIIEDNNIYGAGAKNGAENGTIVVTDNSNIIENRFWTPTLTYLFQNTLTTKVDTVNFSIPNRSIRLVIDDIFTSINIFASGVDYTGKGTVIDAHFDGTVWVVERVVNVKTVQEQVVAFTLTQNLDFVGGDSFTITTEATADWTQINGLVTGLANGTTVQIFLRAGSSARNITAWGAEFKFNGAAPASIPAFQKLVMSFYIRDGLLVEQSRIFFT